MRETVGHLIHTQQIDPSVNGWKHYPW